jgi:hypothetical protein
LRSDGIEKGVFFLGELFALPYEPPLAQAEVMLELPDDESREGFSFLEPSLRRRRHAVVIGDEDAFLLRGVGEQDRVGCPFRKYVDGSTDVPPSEDERTNELLTDVIVGE